MVTETAQVGHDASWWAELPQVSDRFDAATVTEGLSDLIVPKIPAPLLRREAQIAAEVVVRHLNKPQSIEAAERAEKAVERLVATVDRIAERHTGEDSGTTEARAVSDALQGKWAEAAAAMEPVVGTQQLLRVFVRALRLQQFDESLTVRLLRAGQNPGTAIQAGLVVGKYGWWPNWLLKIVTNRALAGTLDEETITALDRCAYAELTPAQSKVASRLLAGDEGLIDTSAQRLEAMGESGAADKLRAGDLTAVALAARSLPM